MLAAPGGETWVATHMSVTRSSALISLLAAATLAVSSCGSGDPQDANEPEGEFEVEITTSKFPTSQSLAKISLLRIGVENTGSETVPELAFTVFTDDGTADGSFNIRSDQPGLANPNRPVWVLENKYPRLAGEPKPKGISGGFRVQTNTFAFGPLDPGDTQLVIWKLTPVQAGTYTLSYVVSAGLDGNAKAVTSSGDEVKGEFVVTITDKPPKARVNNKGEVVTEE